MSSLTSYHEFISQRRQRANSYGFEVAEERLNELAFSWQKRIVRWALLRGRAAIFAECGLGKTLMQLAWAEQVVRNTGNSVIVHTPVGVRSQTLRESEKFKIWDVYVANDQSDITHPGIWLVNYEKLHKIDTSHFDAVVLDESSILKNSNGKVRSQLIGAWAHARFRLACTATPSPNDHMELGNHAEFLGVCQSEDMLNRYFVHDGGETSKWRLRKHAVKDFWSWVASWAVSIGKPSDIGGADDGFNLPPLNIRRHMVEVEDAPVRDGFLFATHGIAATSIHEEKRVSNTARCSKAAEIVASEDSPCVVWCDTNYEADELLELIPNAIEVRGSHREDEKETRLGGFSRGEIQVLISKPSIAGFGMNWQHCHRMVFAGLSYSFESVYQSIRRCWRFGQTKPVEVHIIVADTESAIESTISRKAADFDLMRSGMVEAMKDTTIDSLSGADRGKQVYVRSQSIDLPGWLQCNT